MHVDEIGVAANFIFKAAAGDVIGEREDVVANNAPGLADADDAAGCNEESVPKSLGVKFRECVAKLRREFPALAHCARNGFRLGVVHVPQMPGIESDSSRPNQD